MKFLSRQRDGRLGGPAVPSQHNTTSPDMVFNSFSDGPYPKRPKNEPPPEAKATK